VVLKNVCFGFSLFRKQPTSHARFCVNGKQRQFLAAGAVLAKKSQSCQKTALKPSTTRCPDKSS
jgi:hypothetical protein